MNIYSPFFNKNLIALIILFSFWTTSCSRTNDGDYNNSLSDLMVNIEVLGKSSSFPNGDGTGIIIINATAKNAASYNMRIGSDVLTSTDGKFNYTANISGTNSYTIFITAYNGDKSISNTSQVTVYKAPQLLWSDEFNTDGLPNSNNWGYDTGNNNGWGNNELEYYTNRQENAFVSNGTLKLVLKKETYQGFNYTSARLLSKGKFSFKYGRVDIKAKLPAGGGTWPALWMLGDNISSAG